MPQIIVNDKFYEENKTLLNELMFTNKCLNALNKFKSFIDLIFDKLKTDLDSKDSENYEKLCKEINDILRHKPNEIVIKNPDSFKHKSDKNMGQNLIKEKKLSTKEIPRTQTQTLSKDNTIGKQKVMTQTLDENKRFVCDFVGCGKEYTKRWRYEYHKNVHKGITPYKCNICGKAFGTPIGVSVHTKSVHEEAELPIVCGVDNCNKVFKNKFRLSQHKRITHFYEKRYVCESPNCEYKSSLKSQLDKHKLVHSKERPFVCTVEGCAKTFKDKRYFSSHVKRHSNDREYICPVVGCNKCLKSEKKLNKHTVNCHSGVVKHVCEWPGCEFQTNFKSSLDKHKLVHSLEKNYHCDWPQCGKRFKIKHHLNEHLRIHQNDKRYACHWPGCQYRCVFGGNLNKHMRVHKK